MAASTCPDKPKQNNIATRISDCDDAINEIRQRERAEQQRQEAERERIRKEQEAEQERIRKERERQEQERREREEAERRRQQEQRQREIRYGKNFTVNGVSFTMILVEGGTFTMGDNSREYYNSLNGEYFPATAHQVTLSDYYIGQTEVTQALWKAVMGNLPALRNEYRGYNKPVEATWDKWQEFINRLNELTGLKFRMPTEAEWEYAAMGGNRSRGYIYAGSNDLNEVAWYYENSGGHYQPVATKKPNELYLYDMSGNANEWVSDWFAPYSSAPQTNPTGPRSGKYRIVRGSRYDFSPKNGSHFCIKERCSVLPSYNLGGLRLALSVE